MTGLTPHQLADLARGLEALQARVAAMVITDRCVTEPGPVGCLLRLDRALTPDEWAEIHAAEAEEGEIESTATGRVFL